MKKTLYIIIIAVFLLTGCEKDYLADFLTKPPLTQLTDDTYWSSENNVRTFSFGFYTQYFSGFGSSYSGGTFYNRQSLNDNFAPNSPDQFTQFAPASGGGWDFTWVRKANIFLSRIKEVDMSEEAINHWTGVARFFRGMEYASLVNKYGDIPYFGNVPNEDDPELYKARDPRTSVMDSVLSDFNFAAENVRTEDAITGPNGEIVNKDVVLAFMSRIFLFEGTWQKYHSGNTGKANEYLAAAKWAANEIITNGGYSIGNSYRALCSSKDLKSNPEMILYRVYEEGKLTHAFMGRNNTGVQQGPSKWLIDSYLCSDGLPISLSQLYMGDKTITNLMENRDPRISETFVSYELRLSGEVANFSSSGISTHKFLDEAIKNTVEATLDNNTSDAPIMRYGEVLLNYAEACAELGQLTQADLDNSINKIRNRNGIEMPPLQIIGGYPAIGGVVYDDPQRDPSVPSIIWEIRRERRIELVWEGLRLDDLRRWKKLEYTDTEINPDVNRGAWINLAEYPNTVAIIDGTTEGYIIPSSDPRLFYNSRVYLSPLPLDQITLYEDHGFELIQNPGW